MNQPSHRQTGLLVFAVIAIAASGWNLLRVYGPESQARAAPTKSSPGEPPVFFDANHTDVATASEATDIPNGELVIGVSLNGEAKAYPFSIMGGELANDTVGGEPIAVSW